MQSSALRVLLAATAGDRMDISVLEHEVCDAMACCVFMHIRCARRGDTALLCHHALGSS
jgi:hypothetical protein